MATIEELVANVAKIRKFVGIYLDVPELSPKQKNALKVDLIQLDRNLEALGVALQAPVAVVAPVVIRAAEPLPEEPPNYGPSKVMSSGLYGAWVSAWFQRTFPEAYRDYPPIVHAIEPGAIAAAAERDGCLAQVSAAGTLGFPGGPWNDLGDWSLYTALVTTDDAHSVFHMGELVGTQAGGDGLEFAKSLGFNW